VRRHLAQGPHRDIQMRPRYLTGPERRHHDRQPTRFDGTLRRGTLRRGSTVGQFAAGTGRSAVLRTAGLLPGTCRAIGSGQIAGNHAAAVEHPSGCDVPECLPRGPQHHLMQERRLHPRHRLSGPGHGLPHLDVRQCVHPRPGHQRRTLRDQCQTPVHVIPEPITDRPS
jgi:hypothetical protein